MALFPFHFVCVIIACTFMLCMKVIGNLGFFKDDPR